MALQAFLDDSGSTAGPTFVLGGFISSYDKWERFADAWAAALAESPPIQYYKNSQAMSRKDQFEGWSDVDVQKKISRLIRVIVPNVIYRISVAISHEEFNKFLKFNAVEMLKNPYYTLFFAVLSMVVIAPNQQEERHPISFVFDEQGEVWRSEPLEMMQIIKQNSHSLILQAVRRLSYWFGLPSFSDDKKNDATSGGGTYTLVMLGRFYIDKDNRNIIIPLRHNNQCANSVLQITIVL